MNLTRCCNLWCLFWSVCRRPRSRKRNNSEVELVSESRTTRKARAESMLLSSSLVGAVLAEILETVIPSYPENSEYHLQIESSNPIPDHTPLLGFIVLETWEHGFELARTAHYNEHSCLFRRKMCQTSLYTPGRLNGTIMNSSYVRSPPQPFLSKAKWLALSLHLQPFQLPFIQIHSI